VAWLRLIDVFNIRFVSVGAGDDFFFHLMHHGAVNANGELTATPLVLKTYCSG
jgi:hypothetical protein